MASTIGKVRAVFTASTSGLVSATDQAAAAFKRLGGDSSTLQNALAKLSKLDTAGFAKVGPAADAAGQRLSAFSGLASAALEALRLGTITAEQFATKMAAITTAADQAAAALARGADLAAKYATEEQKLASSIAELDDLLRRGAVTQEVYSRAVADARANYAQVSGAAAAADAAEQARQSVLARGAEIARQHATASEVQASAIAELNDLVRAGAITEETYARAVQAVNDEYLRASGAAASATAAEQARQAIISRGADVTRSLQTAQETYASTVSELSTLLDAGAISVDTYERGVAAAQQTFENATGVTAAQARAMDELTQVMNRGQSVTQQVATAEERYASTMQDLNSLLRQGAISQTTYERATKNAADELKKSKSGADTFAAATRQVESSVGSVVRRLNVLIAIQGAQLFAGIVRGISSVVRSFVDLGQQQAETIDSTGKLADRLGFTYRELAGLGLAGDLAGVSIDQLGAAATKADVAFVRASQGSQTAIAAFQGLGLSLDQLNGQTAAERFQTIITAIAELPTEAERSAAAVRLFGRSGAELLPLFNAGAAGIRAATEQADRLGLTLTGAQFRSVERMNDAFQEAQAAIKGVIGQIVAYLSPAVSSVATAFTDLIGNVGGATIGQTIGDGILQGARFLAQVGDSLTVNLSSVWEYVSQVGAQWSAVFEIGNRVASFFSGIGDTLKAAFGLIVLGVSGTIQSLVEGAKTIGDALGIDTSSLDGTIAAMQGFNESIADSITKSSSSAAKNLTTSLFGSDAQANKAGEAIAGPLTATIDAAINSARQAAVEVDQAVPREIQQRVTVTGDAVAQAIKGVDSRSREGVDLMFQLMRGNQSDVQERIANGIEQIVENTSDMGLDVESVDFAPAAGA